MKNKIFHTGFLLLLLLPLLALDAGYLKISELLYRWNESEQERFARQRLSEIASNVSFPLILNNRAEAISELLNSSLAELEPRKFKLVNWKKVTGLNLTQPFPEHDFMMFSQSAGASSEMVYTNSNSIVSRRSLEIIFSYLTDLYLKKPNNKPHELRRNEKLLKRLFGSGSIGEILARKHKSVPTQVIYNQIPSWLIWNFVQNDEGRIAGFILIVHQNQNIDLATIKIAAQTSGLGKKQPGGFIRLFNSAAPDCYFPAAIGKFAPFLEWRRQIEIIDSQKVLDRYHYDGFPSNVSIEGFRLYSRILPEEKHLLFILLPENQFFHYQGFFWVLNLLCLAAIILAIIRGYILNIWPGTSIKSRFILVFSLALALPVILYVVSSVAYILDRQKADEQILEEMLASSLLDFDAGKEQFENDYREGVRQCLRSQALQSELENRGLKHPHKIFSQIENHFKGESGHLPLAGLAIFDLAGNSILKDSSSIPEKDLAPMAGFYGHSITLNLRKQVSFEEPDFVQPEFKVNEKVLVAYQAYGKNGRAMEGELGRFRGRIFRTQFGRGKIVVLHDYIAIKGHPRFSLLVFWLDSDLDSVVLSRSANNLALKSPDIQIAAFKNTAQGKKLAFKPHRSFDQRLLSQFRNLADASFSSKSSLTRIIVDNRSLIGYSSPHFNDIILVAGIDHYDKNLKHNLRLLAFSLIGLLSLITLFGSAYIVYYRLVYPLEGIKKTLDQVQKGFFSFSGDTARTDELGALNREFKQMIVGLEERNRLASILSDHAVAAISDSETSLKGQRQNGVVLISDIRNFTVMGETYPPEVLTAMLNRHFAEMARIIVAHGGRIYKFIGDAIEAVFIDENKAMASLQSDALKAALIMHHKLAKINEERAEAGNFTYKIGIGLASGEIISGETGSIDTRLEFAMIGEPFKKAELFESLTKKLDGLPIIFDESMAKPAADMGIPVSAHQFTNTSCYSADNHAEKLAEAFFQLDQAKYCIDQQADDSEKVKIVSEKKSWTNNINKSWAVFLLGILCLSFFSYCLFQAQKLRTEKVEGTKRAQVEEILDYGLMKARYADHRAILEELVQHESDRIAQSLTWRETGVERQELETGVDIVLKKLRTAGLEPTQFAALHKPGNKFQQLPQPNWQLIKFLGNPEHKELCEKILIKFLFPIEGLSYPQMGDLQNLMPHIVGVNMDILHLYNDMHARVFEIKRNGIDEYLYWQPILLRKPDFTVKWNEVNVPDFLRGRPRNEHVQQVGIILMNFTSLNVRENFFQTLCETLKNDGLEYLVLLENGQRLCSENFPIAANSISFNQALNMPPQYISKELFSRFEDENFRLLLAAKDPNPRSSDLPQKLAVFLVILWVVKVWYQSVFHQKKMAARFAWQLWLSILAAAIIPVSSVYMVNEFNAIDRSKISLNQERVNLLNTFEKLEQRQFLHETRAVESFSEVFQDRELLRLMKIANASRSPEDVKNVEMHIRDLITKRGLSFSEIIAFSNKGWEHSIYPQVQNRETTEFKRFLQFFISDYFADLGSRIDNPEPQKIGESVKGEMTKDAGLEIFRNLFGSDSYFSLVHGLGIPIKIFANTGLACMTLTPSPSMINPESLFFCLFIDDRNKTIRRMFRLGKTDFPVFADGKIMYGALKRPDEAGYVPDTAKFCRWANANKAPFSMSTRIAGTLFRGEARIGRYNEVMIMVGLIPEELILQGVEKDRLFLLQQLIFSILAIVLLSLLLAADLTRPVQALRIGAQNVSKMNYNYRIPTGRDDELGQLLLTFNSMLKGLKEKELMGKMVSKSARRVAGDEESRRAAEQGIKLKVIILYLAVPSFATFVETMNKSDLINELKAQIETLCRIILDCNGDIDKLMGEKVLAVFYLENDSEAMNLVKAIELIRNAERMGKLPFPVTIGAHYGEVIAGLLGVGNQRDFTIIGDTVNTAARICTKAAELPRERFLVSSRIASMIDARAIELRDFGEVELKGKAETIRLFQLFFK